MPSNELTRQFTQGKMEKDKDDRLIPNGSYRDALNVDVSRSEGDDSGALQVVRGNRQPIDQSIDWERRRLEADASVAFDEFIELTKPFGETIGVYTYPQEEKVYFWNTGRPVDPEFPDVEQPLQNAVYEYDQINNVVSPIIIETDTGDYEAGGGARQDFIGEIQDTQIWSKDSFQDEVELDEAVFQYTKDVSVTDADRVFVNLTCSTRNILDRDADDNIIYHEDGNFCNPTCAGPEIEDCDEALLFYEYTTDYVCRVGGQFNVGDICSCDDIGIDGCDFAQYQTSDCPFSGGQPRTEDDCTSTLPIPDNLNYESKSELVIEFRDEEFPAENWTITPDPDLSIQLQTISQFDLDNTGCTPDSSRPNPLGDVKYTLNGNGAELQPEEFCDPRCPLFVPDGCDPNDSNNNCYPEYCLQTPVLNADFDTQLTDAANTHNETRVITMTNVSGVSDGENITVNLIRLRPDHNILQSSFNSNLNKYNFTAPSDNGRGVFTADNAIIVRGLDALDYQQLDSIFGNVGLASRPVGYTYRVARNGNLSWMPNTDDVFQAFANPSTDTQIILNDLDPNAGDIPAGGGDGETLNFNVEVDRQQTYEINTEDQSDQVHNPDSDRYIDDNTRDV